ncbi:MAG: hypothetical protein N2450_07095 [bacterium]|nr:hypothetical protein [bacterium]
MNSTTLNRSESNLRFVRVISFLSLILALIHTGWPEFGIRLLLVQVVCTLSVILTLLTHLYGILGPFRSSYLKSRKLELSLFGLVLFWSISLVLAASDERLDLTTSSILLKWSLYLLISIPIAFAVTETRFLATWLFSLQNKFSATFALTYLLVIFIGAFLLSSPGAVLPTTQISFFDALFTSVSATAVTGLTTIDIGITFSPFGKTIIGFLILLGGWGPVTFIGLMRILSGERMIYEQKSIGLDILADVQVRVAPLLKTVLLSTIITVSTGTYMLFQIWPDPTLLPIERLGNCLFHSVSAFCNAGLGFYGDSLATVSNIAPRTLIVFSALILVGGIGFPVILDVSKMSIGQSSGHIHTRVTIITTLIIIILSTILFYFSVPIQTDSGDHLIRSIFRSITPRTAGFSDLDYSKLGTVPLVWTVFLMMIGGGASSTAGGLKVTSIAIGLLLIVGYPKDWVNKMKERALGMFFAYFVSLFIGFSLICLFQNSISFAYFFESVSALSTVGLSMNVTSTLERSSQIVLMIFMFLGRIGPLALLDLSRRKQTQEPPPLLIA